MVRTGYSRELERDNYARLRRRLVLGAFVSTVAVAAGAAAVYAPSDTNPLYKAVGMHDGHGKKPHHKH